MYLNKGNKTVDVEQYLSHKNSIFLWLKLILDCRTESLASQMNTKPTTEPNLLSTNIIPWVRSGYKSYKSYTISSIQDCPLHIHLTTNVGNKIEAPQH